MSNAVELFLRTKKVVYKGEKGRKILAYSCYGVDDLPYEYFDKFPYCVVVDGELGVVVSNNNDDNIKIVVGDIIPEDVFQDMIKTIKHCGEKLHNINQRIKTLKAEWKGEEEFKI